MIKDRTKIANLIFGIFASLLLLSFAATILSPSDNTDGSFLKETFSIGSVFDENSKLKVGDEVTHINGETLKEIIRNRFKENKNYNFQIGENLTYTVIREGESIDIPVKLNYLKRSESLSLGYSYLICLLVGLIGYVTLIASPQTKYSLSFFLLTIGVGFTLSPGMYNAFNISFPFYMLLLYFITGPISALSATYLPYFFLTFPTDLLKKKSKLFMISNILLISIPILIEIFVIKEPIFLHYYTVQTYYIFMLYVILAFIIAIILSNIYTKDYFKRQQLKYVSFGMFLVILLSVILVVIPFIVYREVNVDYRIFTTLMLIFPISVLFAIKKFKLFLIDKIINRTFIYSLASLITSAISIFLFFVISYLFKFNNQLSDYIVIAPVLIFTVFIMFPVLNLIENLWQKIFQRKQLELVKTSELILGELSKALTYEELFGYVQNVIPNHIKVKNSKLIIIRNNEFFTLSPFNLTDWVKIESENKDKEAVSSLKFLSTPVYTSEIGISNNKLFADYKIISPINFKKELIAIWLIGEKQSEDFFFTQDFEALAVISQQLGLAISNAQLFEDIKEKANKEKEVLQKELELKSLKEEYIRVISHFMRTPITSIQGYSDLLEDEVQGNKNAEEYLHSLKLSFKNISSIVEKLIIISSIENQKIKLYLTKASINDVLRLSIDETEELRKEYGIKLNTEIEEGIEVMAERNRLQRAISSIIENAIIFNKENGNLEISAKREDDRLVLKIRDEGEGISEEEKKKLFIPFHRAHYEEKGFVKGEGMGIGIYIAKLIIDAHNGEIVYDSEIGKGTTVTIILPIAK